MIISEQTQGEKKARTDGEGRSSGHPWSPLRLALDNDDCRLEIKQPWMERAIEVARAPPKARE